MGAPSPPPPSAFAGDGGNCSARKPLHAGESLAASICAQRKDFPFFSAKAFFNAPFTLSLFCPISRIHEEPACSRSPSDPANARLIHRGKPPAPRYSSPPCTYSRRRAFALSTIKRNFQRRKNALQISRFPPSAARKTKKTPPSVRFCEKTADPREQKHGHPPSWCAKKIPS